MFLSGAKTRIPCMWAGAVIVLILVIMLPATAQNYNLSLSGDAYAGETMMGSGASGGPFRYWSAWPDWNPDLNVICQAGQRCDIDLPIQFYAQPDPSFTSGCFKSACTPYIDGSVSFSTVSFITPRGTTSYQVNVSVPVTVNGYVSGSYSNWQGGGMWNLWDVSFSGRGTATITLLRISDNQYLALNGSVRYRAKGQATSWVGELPVYGDEAAGVAVGNGSLFVAQTGPFGTISQLDAKTGSVENTRLAPSANGFDGRSTPSDLAYGSGHLFMTDVGLGGKGAVFEFDPAGPPSTTALHCHSVAGH